MSIESAELQDAYFRVIDLAEELVDRVSFLSFAPAWEALVSVTVPEVARGDSFEIALPAEGYRRSTVKLSASDIEGLGEKLNDVNSVAMRLFRRGLSARSPYQVLGDLWTGLEVLATAEARQAGEFVEETCPSCHAVWRAIPASQKHIRNSFREARGVEKTEEEAASSADKARSLRGKVVHGGRLQVRALREDAEKAFPGLQAALAVALVKELGIKPKSARCQHLGLPYLASRMTAPEPGSSEFKVVPSHFRCPAGLSFLPDAYSEAQPFQVEIGLFMPVLVDALALPNLREA